ncbi:hypothetical protein C4572_02995 [Candidatus Parcubacteria bacterium]|nr:MAG: hypothetical protein C4572_02995 [Candidatus Parcubacteria bacterium]
MNGQDDYYEFFSTPSDYNDAEKTITNNVYLPGGIYFTAPADTVDIIFGKITGATAATTTVSISNSDGISKTVTVTPAGTVY